MKKTFNVGDKVRIKASPVLYCKKGTTDIFIIEEKDYKIKFLDDNDDEIEFKYTANGFPWFYSEHLELVEE